MRFRDLCASLWLTSLSTCGPAIATENLEDNVRAVCIMGRSVCYGQGIAEEPVEMCVEALAFKRGARALAMSAHCLDVYADFFACAAQWSCSDFLAAPDADVPCMDYRDELNRECPGLSPFHEDRLDEPLSPQRNP